MKKHLSHLFTKCCIAAAMLLATANSAVGQERISEVQGLYPKEAIIRHWKDHLYVVYSHDGSDAHFTLLDLDAALAYDISRTFPNTIYDFEIDQNKDEVFFCGAFGAQGMVGWFDIPSLWAGATTLNVALLGTPTSSSYTSGSEAIGPLYKIEVLRCPDGFHAFMTGDAHFYTSSSSFVNRCVVDFHYDAPGNSYYCEFSQEHAGVFLFDDIAVTANEVVAVGHKNSGGNLYLTSFQKPASAAGGQDIFSLTGMANTYYSNALGCLKVPGMDTNYLVEHLHDDYYATVGYVGNDYNGYSALLSVFNGTSNLVDQILIPQGINLASQWKLKELRYNTDKDLLYLLQDMTDPVSPSLESVACMFYLNPTGIFNPWNGASYETGIEYFSIEDGRPDNYAIAVGQGPDMRIWQTNYSSSSPCATDAPLPYIREYMPNDFNSISHPVSKPSVNPLSFLIINTQYPINKICE